jgi:hypothetical protein
MRLLDSKLCHRAEGLLDVVIVVGQVASKNQTLENLANRVMVSADPCLIMLRNEAMVPSYAGAPRHASLLRRGDPHRHPQHGMLALPAGQAFRAIRPRQPRRLRPPAPPAPR